MTDKQNIIRITLTIIGIVFAYYISGNKNIKVTTRLYWKAFLFAFIPTMVIFYPDENWYYTLLGLFVLLVFYMFSISADIEIDDDNE